MASLNGYLDCVKKLLINSTGFEIDTSDELGRTCLHAAACGGYAFVYYVEISHIHCFIYKVFLKCRNNKLGMLQKL